MSCGRLDGEWGGCVGGDGGEFGGFSCLYRKER